MKKFAIILLSICICVCVFVGLTSCSDSNEPTGCGNDHSYGEPVVVKEATCMENGETHRICSECGDILHDYPSRINHIYENGFCTMCERYEDEYMYFELNDDGESYKVSEYRGDANAGTVVTVPQTYRGKPVTVIGANAFAGTQHMTKINLPSTITEIGGSAFSNCTSLEAPILPEGLKIIQNSAFMGCKFETISLPSGLTVLGKAFQNCSNLKELTIPVGITEIPDEAFWLCNSLESVTMLGEVERVGLKAFKDCQKLKSFSAKGTPIIESEAFRGCGELCLFDVKEGVGKIGNSAFSGCMRLYSITLAEELTEIGANAFTCDLFLHNGLPRLAQVINYSSLDLVLEDKSAYGGIMRFARNAAINLERDDVVPSAIEYINDFVFMVETGTSLDGEEVHKWFTLIDYIGDDYAPQFPDLRSDEYVLEDYTIASYALYQNDIILFADMPEGVTCIEDYSFSDCNRLLRIDIPLSVEYVSYFTNSYDCNIAEIINRTLIDLSKMKNICGESLLSLNQVSEAIDSNRHDWTSHIKNVDGFLVYDWYENIDDPIDRYILGYIGEASTLSIPSLPTDKQFNGYIIRSYAFADSTCVGVALPNGLTRIEEGAFQSVNIGTLVIPNSVEYIGFASFADAKIEQLTIPDTTRVNRIFGYGGSNFDDEGIRYVGNILIDADISSDDDIVVKEGTVRIGDEAFWCERSMVKLTIAEGVKYIGINLCYDCSNLKTIVLPKSVEEIGNGLINRCNALERIIYGGTMAEWLSLVENVQLCDGMSGRIEYIVECSDGSIDMLNNNVVE